MSLQDNAALLQCTFPHQKIPPSSSVERAMLSKLVVQNKTPPVFCIEELLNPALQVEAQLASICSWR
jgi:hypothetical protein